MEQKPRKGKPCTICSKTKQELLEIQAAVVNGIPLTEIASQFGVAKSSLHRHAIGHMGRTKRIYERTFRCAETHHEEDRCA